MPRIPVFLAYVDSFVGARLLRQFQQYPAHYRVYGCTWDAAAAEELNAAAQQQQKRSAQSNALNEDALDAGGSAARPADDADSSILNESRGTLTPGGSACNNSAALPESSGVWPEGENTPSATGGRLLFGNTQDVTDGTLISAAGAGEGGHSSKLHAFSTFFSRSDTVAVRAALLACDRIVLELRQAQTVLEVVQFLQGQPMFLRPKKLVLLSSLMTWYSTPSLEKNEIGETDGASNEGADNDEGLDGADDVEAPYPPASPRFLENIVAEVQDQLRHATVDAMRGDDDAAKVEGAGDEADGEEEGSQDAPSPNAANDGAAGAQGAAEVLTEDQYNRRVPHLQYLKWRDAEKAVAAAHHAKGLPLDTFVICAGLPYGGEEDALEPLFRLAWSAEADSKDNDDKKHGAATHNSSAPATKAVYLPIFGTGHQHVPLVHAQDLACFVRRLLHCPADALPFPERRYLFATDGSNRNSWQGIVSAVNRMFGGRCLLRTISPAAYPLYRNVEKFTLDLQVEPETMRTIMDRTEDVEDSSGPSSGDQSGTNSASLQPSILPNTWIAEGGIRRHLRAVADEFATARGVTPLRIALVGPPLVGKTYLATRVARYYRLPCVSLDSVVADYTAALQELRNRVDSTKAAAREAEHVRRVEIKRRRLLARQQREWDTKPEGGDSDAVDAEVAEGKEAQTDSNQEYGEFTPGQDRESYRPASGGGGRTGRLGPADPTATASPRSSPNAGDAGGNTDNELSAVAMMLTPAEEDELDTFVNEWWMEQPQAPAWAAKIAEMERVLLLRLHPRPPTPEANPKKKAANAAGGGANGKKKGNRDAQKTREEEEELHQLKAALQLAPFQPRALALMLRWRLAQPDCQVQGFVLDGIPTTLEMARLVFGSSDDPQLKPPLTEEEALRPRYAGEGGSAPPAAADDHRDETDESAGVAAAPPKELASDARLPNHVVVMQASDTYLLSRLKAMGAASEEGVVTARGNDDATRPVDVEAFHLALQIYKREYVEAAYSVLSYWECAAASTAPALGTGGAPAPERRAEVHLINIEGREPLVPPLPPTSAYAEPNISDTEQLLEQVILGRPHNFGKSLEEIQQEAVRQRCLQAEEEEARAQEVAAQAAAETQECEQEAEARTAAEERLLALKQMDVAELEAHKAPMTHYLQKRVLPLLHKGLLEVCATRPADPVDYLAEWLIRHNPHDDIFCDL